MLDKLLIETFDLLGFGSKNRPNNNLGPYNQEGLSSCDHCAAPINY